MNERSQMTKVVEAIDMWQAAGVKQFVYFVQDATGPVKIGTAVDPQQRLALLQCGNPRPLELQAIIPGDRATESSLHSRFWEHRMVGEWFGLEDIILPFAHGVAERAEQFWHDTGKLPVSYLNDIEPVDQFRRDEIWHVVQICEKRNFCIAEAKKIGLGLDMPDDLNVSEEHRKLRSVRRHKVAA